MPITKIYTESRTVKATAFGEAHFNWLWILWPWEEAHLRCHRGKSATDYAYLWNNKNNFCIAKGSSKDASERRGKGPSLCPFSRLRSVLICKTLRNILCSYEINFIIVEIIKFRENGKCQVEDKCWLYFFKRRFPKLRWKLTSKNTFPLTPAHSHLVNRSSKIIFSNACNLRWI